MERNLGLLSFVKWVFYFILFFCLCIVEEVVKMRSKLEGGLWGVVVGDAFGYPFQFTSREEMESQHPSPENLPMKKGLWSDDTSLTLATADALTYGYDLFRIANNFIAWYRDGKFTPRGRPFDKGKTTKQAIKRLINGRSPLLSGSKRERSNGNGSLMRILPVAYYAYFKLDSIEERLRVVHETSSITHAHPRSLIGCGIYSLVVWDLLERMDKLEAYTRAVEIASEFYSKKPFSKELKHYSRVLGGDIHSYDRAEIRGSGYVVHTLEASLWAFLRNESFASAIKEVVSLGEDADTTGAVTGGLAGTYYGVEGIPEEWLGKIEAREYVMETVNAFIDSLLGG